MEVYRTPVLPAKSLRGRPPWLSRRALALSAAHAAAAHQPAGR